MSENQKLLALTLSLVLPFVVSWIAGAVAARKVRGVSLVIHGGAFYELRHEVPAKEYEQSVRDEAEAEVFVPSFLAAPLVAFPLVWGGARLVSSEIVRLPLRLLLDAVGLPLHYLVGLPLHYLGAALLPVVPWLILITLAGAVVAVPAFYLYLYVSDWREKREGRGR